MGFDKGGYHFLLHKPVRGVTSHGPEPQVWKLKPLNVTKWQNPLMGWTSSSALQAEMIEEESGLTFYTKEEAERFCQMQGMSYTVQEPNQRKKQIRSYAHNFRF